MYWGEDVPDVSDVNFTLHFGLVKVGLTNGVRSDRITIFVRF